MNKFGNCTSKIRTGARVEWIYKDGPLGLTLDDLGEITAIIDDNIWIKWDKLDRSYMFDKHKFIVIY